VAIYREEPPTLIELVLSSGDLSQAVDAQQALEVIGDGDRRIVDRLGATRVRLSALAEDLKNDRAAADAQVTATQAHQEQLDGLIARRRAVLDDAQSQLDAGLSRARAAQRARAAAAAQARGERDVEATLRRRAQADPSPATTAAAPGAAAASAIPDSVAAHLARIAQCESGGDPTLADGQYRGKYQFDMATWQAVGGTGDPAAAPEAEQDRRAAMLYAQRGGAPWPVCQYR
jgi:peptidoglycan hydrolase CwlO-like protein